MKLILSKVTRFSHAFNTDPNIGVHAAGADNSFVFSPEDRSPCTWMFSASIPGLVSRRCDAGSYRHSDSTSCLSVVKDISDCGSVMKLALSCILSRSTS